MDRWDYFIGGFMILGIFLGLFGLITWQQFPQGLGCGIIITIIILYMIPEPKEE